MCLERYLGRHLKSRNNSMMLALCWPSADIFRLYFSRWKFLPTTFVSSLRKSFPLLPFTHPSLASRVLLWQHSSSFRLKSHKNLFQFAYQTCTIYTVIVGIFFSPCLKWRIVTIREMVGKVQFSLNLLLYPANYRLCFCLCK